MTRRDVKDEPLLSIITVVFRDRDELQAILENLRAFACSSLEVIVIDGGSDDGTLDLLKTFHPQPAFWVSEPDNGIYDAMNKGLAAAEGTYVLHLNAGDRLLSVPWDALRVGALDQTDVICGRVLLDGDVTFVSRTGMLSKMDNTWHHQGTFYRRSAHLGYNIAFRTHADFDHNQRLMRISASVREDSTLIASHRGDGVTAVGTSHEESLRIVRQHYGWFWWTLARLRFVAQDIRHRLRLRNSQAGLTVD